MKKKKSRWIENVEKSLCTRCEAIARACSWVRKPGTTLLLRWFARRYGRKKSNAAEEIKERRHLAAGFAFCSVVYKACWAVRRSPFLDFLRPPLRTLFASISALAFSIPHLNAQEDTSPGQIVVADLLAVREPKSEAQSRLRVIRLMTRSGAIGYGDYLDYGLPAEEAEEALARLVNRYAAQGYKQNIFLTDPSMRAVGAGHTVIGQTAPDVLNAKTREWPGRALYHREGFGRIWQGPGKSALIIAMQTALLDLAGENGPGQVRLCPSIRIDRELDGKRRLCTPEAMQQTVASLKQAGFTAVRLELAGALDDEMKTRGECAPYRYPQEVLGQISQLVSASKKAAGTTMDVTVAADMNLSTDGLTYLALRCERNEVALLENPMAVRHLIAQGHARKEFSQPLGFGGDYHALEDFSQGIKHQIGTVLTPDAGRIGGVTMLAQAADLAKDAQLKVAPVVQGGPFSLLAVARSLSGREEVLWVTGSYQDEWLKEDGVLKNPLRMAQGMLVAESCEIDEMKFEVKRIAQEK